MAAIGRNAPCPCGSGKKYKACCLEKDEALRRGAPAVEPEPDLRSRVLDDLTEFANRSHQRVLKEARDLFPRVDDFEDEDCAPIEPPHEDEELEWMSRLLNGALFDLSTGPHGETVAEAYLRRMSTRIGGAEKSWIERMLKAPLTPFELVAVQPGVGFLARSLWTGEERFISESLGSNDVNAGDLIVGRTTREDETFVLEGGVYSFPPDRKPMLEMEIAEYLEENGATGWTDLSEAKVRLFSVVIHTLWTDLVIYEEEEEADLGAADSPAARRLFGVEVLERRYPDWVDTSLPVLDGQTPRETARESEGRATVSGLLSYIEDHYPPVAAPGAEPCDFRWIRRELRLPRQ